MGSNRMNYGRAATGIVIGIIVHLGLVSSRPRPAAQNQHRLYGDQSRIKRC